MINDIRIQELSKIFGKRIKSQKCYNPNVQENSEKTVVIDKQVRIREFSSLISVDFAIETTIVVALNKPDKICLINKPHTINGFPYPLFCDNKYAENPDSFLCDNVGLFKDLNLSKNESLIIYKNGICLFADKNRDFVSLIDKLRVLSKQLPKVDKIAINLKGLPKSLEILLPLIEKWSISDDELRDELNDSLNSNDRMEIIAKVEPLINEINDYLNSFKQNPLTEIAQKIGNLTELYEEIKTAYNKRSYKTGV